MPHVLMPSSFWQERRRHDTLTQHVTSDNLARFETRDIEQPIAFHHGDMAVENTEQQMFLLSALWQHPTTTGLCLVIIYYQEYDLKDLSVQSVRSGTDQNGEQKHLILSIPCGRWQHISPTSGFLCLSVLWI